MKTYKIVPNFIPHWILSFWNKYIALRPIFYFLSIYTEKELNKYNELYKRIKK